MTRIDPDALAIHLEVALSCAPVDTLAALQDSGEDVPLTRLHNTWLIGWVASKLPAMALGMM